MKRVLFTVLMIMLCSALSAASLRAVPGRPVLEEGKFMIGPGGIAFDGGPVTYGNVGSGSMLSFMLDPYADHVGLTGDTGYGISGKMRAASFSIGSFSLMAVPGRDHAVTLSYISRYIDAGILWMSSPDREKGLTDGWEEVLREDIFSLGLSARYGEWIEIHDIISYSSEIGMRNLIRGESELGPFSFMGAYGETLGQRSFERWAASFSFEDERLRTWFRIAYGEKSCETERFTPFRGRLGWSLTLGGWTVGIERRMIFSVLAERKSVSGAFVQSERFRMSFDTDLKLGFRLQGERCVIGVDDGGAWAEVSVVPDLFTVFFEKGKIGFEIVVEFPEEGD